MYDFVLSLLGNVAGPLLSHYEVKDILLRAFGKMPKEIKENLAGELAKVIVRNEIFVRLAGLSGATAVVLSAYGDHIFSNATGREDKQLKKVFETGNRCHILHSIALLAVPLARKPYLVGPLMLTGMTVFSGTCYYHALTGNPATQRFTLHGKILLSVAWMSVML